MVPVAVRPASQPSLPASLRTAANKQGQSKSFARPRPSRPGGSRAPSTFSSCGTILPCSLVECGSLPHIHREQHHPAWLSTPIIPSHIGQSHRPILPTSNFFSLLPRRHRQRQRHRHRNRVVAAAAGCCARCLLSFRATRSQGCQDCNVGPSSLPSQQPQSCMSLLPFPTLISTHCPGRLPSCLVRLPCLRSPPL